MADEDNNILMKIVPQNDDGGPTPLAGESQTVLKVDDLLKKLPPDPLLDDFKPGFFCEISNFQFKAHLSGSEAEQAGKQPPKTTATGRQGFGTNTSSAQAGNAAPAANAAAAPAGDFAKWKATTVGDVCDILYPFSMDEIEFDKQMETSSMVLFTNTSRAKSFASVSFVKRKITGNYGLRGFLRLDFKGVLFTKVRWSSDDPVKESCGFVFRELKVRYLKQDSDGSLQGTAEIEWSYPTALVHEGDDNG